MLWLTTHSTALFQLQCFPQNNMNIIIKHQVVSVFFYEFQFETNNYFKE